MSKPAKIGPWGGNGGTEYDVQPPKPTRLVSVTISSGVVIDAISFNYVSNDEETPEYIAGKWGGNGGTDDTITLDRTNRVTEIAGTVGTFGTSEIVTSLEISTSKDYTRRYGTANGTPFRIPVLEGKIVGFFARAGTFLDAIGIYVAP